MATKFDVIPQITIKAIGCDAKQAVKQGKSVYMCRIFGEASDMKTKEARSGDPYTFLIGEFRGINAEGQGFEANKLFLPASLQEQLEAQLKTSEGKAVIFGYDIHSGPDEKSATGYRYAWKPVMKSEAADRLKEMTTKLEAVVMPENKAVAVAAKK